MTRFELFNRIFSSFEAGYVVSSKTIWIISTFGVVNFKVVIECQALLNATFCRREVYEHARLLARVQTVSHSAKHLDSRGLVNSR